MPLWAIAVTALLLGTPLPRAAPAQNQSNVAASGLAAEEKESCTRNLKVIYDAIRAYQFDHKDLPNWLSDLVPDYLLDGNALICPVCRRTGRTEAPPFADPKLACSYLFEFCPVPLGVSGSPGSPTHTRREWKRRQMGLVGSVVPVVRCRHHNPVLNLGFDGTVYESLAQWELVFTNRVRPTELTVQAIFGGQDPLNDPPASQPGAPRELAARDPARNHLIDLTGFYNSALSESWQGGSGDNLASLSSGPQTLGGVDFDVRGIIQLKGKSPALAKFPAEVKGLPVHQRCQHLYFLHAASSGGKANEGDQIGAYIVHLPNNQLSLEIPIYYGRSVRNWHQYRDEADPEKGLKPAWTGENAAGRTTNTRIRLFVTAWNLAPGVEVDSIDFVSAMENAAPFLVAITVD